MNDRVGPWVRRFLVEYLIGERNYSLHTQQSRRDTFVLFLPFAAQRRRCALEQLALSQINPKLVREFVRHLEQVRHCSPSTINQRVISLRAWARFVGINSPEHVEWSSQMRTLHLKKHAPAPMNYLEKEEMKALLAAPDQRDRQGFRDYVLLLFLYNTGARASEASRLTVGDLDFVSPVASDLKMKAKALARCEAPLREEHKGPSPRKGLIGFLRNL
jgi:site-specific recombinase XerD